MFFFNRKIDFLLQKYKKNPKGVHTFRDFFILVGTIGFEPMTSSM